jgi:hypothetical protein
MRALTVVIVAALVGAAAFPMLAHRAIAQPTVLAWVDQPPGCGSVLEWDGGVRGVLLVGKFRTQQGLAAMSPEDQRNTLITELAGRTKNTGDFYQGLNEKDLAGAGALLVYLRGTGSRTDQQIKTMSADDMRNTVIVEVAAQTGLSGQMLQAHSNMDLIKLVLGGRMSGGSGMLPPPSYVRGVLLVGKFRTQQGLIGMSAEDQRNTLITELGGRTKDTGGFYQGLNNNDLAGAGALLVWLRETGSRTDQQVKTMSADDMRNTVIVEVEALTGFSGNSLQALSNMDIIRKVLEMPYKQVCIK